MTTHVENDEATAKAVSHAAATVSDDEPPCEPHAPVLLRFAPVLKKLTEQEFFEFCKQQEDDVRLELTGAGDLIIMSPTGSASGNRGFKLTAALGEWVRRDGTGQGFDSSAGFRLPNGAMRSPDFSWVKKERWDALAKKQRERFAPLCPDFVVELRPRTDSLKMLRRKMEEYVACGAQLGWLIDPFRRKLYIYRPQTEVEELNDPQTISGEPALPVLMLDLREIWD